LGPGLGARGELPALTGNPAFDPLVMSVMTTIELGLDTFGDVTVDAGGRLQPQARVLRDVIAQAELADRVGVDFFGVGEHHRPDFAISAPEVLLATIAGRTQRLRLGTAVTVPAPTTRSGSTSASARSTPSPTGGPR
jgi:hypothetical protein